jgi:hypothetical protein
MAEQNGLSRRDFTVAAALAALSGVAITISACGGGGSPTSSTATGGSAPGGTGSGTASGDKAGVVSANHGHSAVITAALLTAGGALRLDIKGTADHPHTVELSAAEVAAIAGGTKTTKESSTDASHSHDVTFN